MRMRVDKVKPVEGASGLGPRRMRTTIIVEYETQEDLNEALGYGLECARERFIGIRFGLEGRDEHGPKIEVRTTRCRRKP